MIKETENIDYDFPQTYQKMIKFKENSRNIEEIVQELKNELVHVKEESFLVHAMRLILELEQRKTSHLYVHLQSPMKQTLYLIDVYYSVEKRDENLDMNDNLWERIALLLDEIEMTYFVNIGFNNDRDLYHDERDGKIEISLPTFMDYFGSSNLIYEEQTLDKITRYFKQYEYEDYIKENLGFSIDEVLKFISHVRTLNNNRLNEIIKPCVETFNYYNNNPKEWEKLTTKFEERGICNPHDWLKEPELNGILNSLAINPGEIHIIKKEDLTNVEINSKSLNNILNFFTYDKNALKGKVIYYAEKRQSESFPLIQLEDKYICHINKFFIESLYFRIDEFLTKNMPKYKKNKDKAFEKRVFEVFQHFFPKKTKFFSSYSVDGVSENDLLIIFESICIIVEIKDCGFREPLRDPIKAYERIRNDFQKAIQKGYDQCKRVEDVLLSGKDINVIDSGNKNIVKYQIKNRKIEHCWSIVVTSHRYGVIQTDLSLLLQKVEDGLYPWSVCIDDLEAFLILMKKLLRGIAPNRFIEYLDYRERLHEHILCSDELELCGWYLIDREQFKKHAGNEEKICTTPKMGNIFDAYYRVGLGFKNELDIEYKKQYKLPDYQKHFELNEMTLDNMKQENK